MSALIAVIVLGAAAWFVLKLAGGPSGPLPRDSVMEFSHAMRALDPDAPARPKAPSKY
ncbi:MAG: hypothetical protein ACR2HR_09420 [Euzebya sp.]